MDKYMQVFNIPARVIAEIDAVKYCLAEQAKLLGGTKALLITGKSHVRIDTAEIVKGYLAAAGISVTVYTDVESEPSLENLQRSVDYAKTVDFNIAIAVGGGSVMDICKMMAQLPFNDPKPVVEYMGARPGKIPKKGVPTILIPTTSGSGSEISNSAVFYDADGKNKLVAQNFNSICDCAIVDPVMTLTCPASVTAAAGMDALANAIEAYTGLKARPMSDIFAEDAIKRIGKHMRRAVAIPDDLESRYQMCLGSLHGGIANGVATVNGVHALSYPLGGEYRIPHGVSVALMMPYVMRKNIIGSPEKFANAAAFMGESIGGLSTYVAAEKACEAVARLNADIGIPLRIRDLGIPRDVLPRWAKLCYETQQRLLSNNPYPLSVEDIEEVYGWAY